MTEQGVSEVVEEYLETIFRLQEKAGDGARTNDIVRTLKVVPGTVTNTIERLEKEGYVNHRPYRGVSLTEKGRRIAVQVVRRHRLSERLLTDILHVDWGKAHDIACKIEHHIGDEEIMSKIEEALGNPKTCPHGNPIPSNDSPQAEKELEERNFLSLADLQRSDHGTVIRLRDENVEVLQRLEKLGVVPGASVEIVEKEPTEGFISIKTRGSTVHTLSQRVASIVEVGKEITNAAVQEPPKKKENGKSNHSKAYGEYEP